VRNKQDELEALVSSQSYDVVCVGETGWSESHGRSVGMQGYRLFSRDRQGRQGGGDALRVRESVVAQPQLAAGDHAVALLLLLCSGEGMRTGRKKGETHGLR